MENLKILLIIFDFTKGDSVTNAILFKSDETPTHSRNVSFILDTIMKRFIMKTCFYPKQTNLKGKNIVSHEEHIRQG